MKRTMLIGIGVFLGVLILAFCGFYIFAMRPQFAEYEKVRNMPIAEVDLSKVPN